MPKYAKVWGLVDMILRVMTYNVHSCRNPKGEDSLSAIGDLINQYNPSIVGLNEIERLSPRTRFSDQARQLSRYTNMQYVFGPAIKIGPVGFYGNALLTQYPVGQWQNIRLRSKLELRACLKARLLLPGTHLTVIVTHLGLNKRERAGQISAIVDQLRGEPEPYIVMGDFNAAAEELHLFEGIARDIGAENLLTFPADSPKARIDYILVSKNIIDYDLKVIKSEASDHLPLLATLEV